MYPPKNVVNVFSTVVRLQKSCRIYYKADGEIKKKKKGSSYFIVATLVAAAAEYKQDRVQIFTFVFEITGRRQLRNSPPTLLNNHPNKRSAVMIAVCRHRTVYVC
uniref:Uncharacterized protein n=1 Tax=Sipha flava TaxID=143950 RepID=A0A2S2PV90_9HEMI